MLAQRREIAAIYAAGVVQGVALVTFPAASTVFTSAADFGLSSTEYGAMFVPQVITAIGSALLGASLTRSLGAKRVYLLGLDGNLLAMALLAVAQFVMHEHALAYDILLAATACMGIGFGLTVPVLNTFAAMFFPSKVGTAVLILNALLGLGTMLAPLFVAVFVGFGTWWGLPVLVCGLTVALLLFSRRLPLDSGVQNLRAQTQKGKAKVPGRFWAFAAFALLYGICETMNGNWASLYMTHDLGASTTLASFALTLFWGTVTAGRVLFAAIERWFPEEHAFRVLPFVTGAAFLITANLPKDAPFAAITAFGLAGLSCSALLPLTISFGQRELTAISTSVAAGLIAFYQIGYGIAAFGVGPFQNWGGVGLNSLYGAASVVALAMAALCFVVVRRQPAPGGSNMSGINEP